MALHGQLNRLSYSYKNFSTTYNFLFLFYFWQNVKTYFVSIYIYDAADNNMCQTFVQNIVDFNGLTSNIVDNATLAALKPQNAKELIATLGRRSSIVKSVTDTGGKVDTLLFDRIKLKIRGSKN